MAAKDSIGKASAAALAAQRNQYVRRILEDEELRANLLAAYAAARSAYGRVGNGRPATKALFEDRKLQRELIEAAVALREASNALKEPPRRRRRRGGVGRALVLALVGAVLALALSESLRSKVLDMLFGAEEEFDYSSTTMPAQEAPSSVGATAS
jgi:ferric-dicitrate binding protein FerR (iron transport regulator)